MEKNVSKELDLSTSGPINNPKHRNISDERRCVAHKKTGERCQRPALLGATVCRSHGGAAKHVQAAAKVRIVNAAERMAEALLRIAEDPNAPMAVKLGAIKDALDRAGLSPQQAVQITHETKAYEVTLNRIHRGPRPGSDPVQTDDIVEAEIVPACKSCSLDFSEWEEPPGGYPNLCRNCRRRRAVADAESAAPTPKRPQRPYEPARQPRDPSDTPPGGEFGLMSAEDAAALASHGIARPRRKRARR